MGDTHFLLRHAIVGGIFLLFAWIGWWLFDPKDAWIFLQGKTGPDSSAALFAAVSSPVIGITVQAVYILAMHRRKGAVFGDAGRKILAAEMRHIFTECAKDGSVPGDVLRRLDRAPDDSFFVWLYHRSAPVDLIEWARRRRSYHYLGINLVFAATAGFLAGAAAPWVATLPTEWKAPLIFLAASLWCAGAWQAAKMMRRDVDRMELLWVAARIYPGLKARLEKRFGTVIDETRPDPGAGNTKDQR